MKKLLNTLYITNPDIYLGREGENIVIKDGKITLKRFPIHILEGIICFNYIGVSPSLMELCSENNISISFLSPSGRFCGMVVGKENGNVHLRREQYRIADNEKKSLEISKLIIYSKLVNSRSVLKRALRDHSKTVNISFINNVIDQITINLDKIKDIENSDQLRGIEGDSAKFYFSCFDELVLNKEFVFLSRSRRPPKNEINAMLSFFYSLLTYDCTSALQSVGLDPYVGFFHVDRPGRMSLSLDLVEEFRAYIADRFVLSCINLRIVSRKDFEIKENKSVLLNEKGRSKLLDSWQKKKQTEIAHPFLGEKVKLGLLPYIQARLLSKYIRQEIDLYPPFLSR